MKFLSLCTSILLLAAPAFADETKPAASFTWETSGSCSVTCDSSDGKATATRTGPIKGVIVAGEEIVI